VVVAQAEVAEAATRLAAAVAIPATGAAVKLAAAAEEAIPGAAVVAGVVVAAT